MYISLITFYCSFNMNCIVFMTYLEARPGNAVFYNQTLSEISSEAITVITRKGFIWLEGPVFQKTMYDSSPVC